MRVFTRFLCALVLVCAVMLPVADAPAQVGNLDCGVLQDAVSSTGNGSTCGVGGYNTVTFQVTGTTLGSVMFEGTLGSSTGTYTSLVCMNTPGLVYQNGVSAFGIYHCSAKNFSHVRARISSAGTSVTVRAIASTLTWGTGAF